MKTENSHLSATIAQRLRGFYDINAWVLILLGVAVFSLRIPFSPDGFINLPVAFTVLQTAGLTFSVFGIQLMASMAVWPTISFSTLLDAVVFQNNSAAGLTLLGIFLFNGLSVIGVSVWLTSALGAGIGAR